MPKRKKEDLKEPSSPLWMTTYGDMVTLLLTFFVLLISFSSIDSKKFSKALFSLKGALGLLKQPIHVTETAAKMAMDEIEEEPSKNCWETITEIFSRFNICDSEKRKCE